MKKFVLFFAVVLLLTTAVPAFGAVTINTTQGADVTFTWKAPDAKKVFLAGSFNSWSATATPMIKGEDGVWSVTLQLNPGRYLYKYVVDGVWTQDIECPASADDGFGGRNSLFIVADSSTDDDGAASATGNPFVPSAFIKFQYDSPKDGDPKYIFESYWKATGTIFSNWDYFSEISVKRAFGKGIDSNEWEIFKWDPSTYDTENQVKMEHFKLTFTGIPYIDVGFKLNSKAWDFHDPVVLLQSNFDDDYVYEGTRVDITTKEGAPVQGGFGWGTKGGYADDKKPNQRVAYGELYKDFGAYTIGAAATYRTWKSSDWKEHEGMNAVWFSMKPLDPLTLTAEYIIASHSWVKDAATEDKTGYFVSGEYQFEDAKIGLSYLSKGQYVVSELAGNNGDLNQWRSQELGGNIIDITTGTNTCFYDFNKIAAWAEYNLSDNVTLKMDFNNRVEKDNSKHSIFMYKPGIVFNDIADFLPKLNLSYEFYTAFKNAQYSNVFQAEANFVNDYNAIVTYRTYSNAYNWSGEKLTDPGFKVEVNKVLSMLPYKPKVYAIYVKDFYKPDSLRFNPDLGYPTGFQIKLEYDISI